MSEARRELMNVRVAGVSKMELDTSNFQVTVGTDITLSSGSSITLNGNIDMRAAGYAAWKITNATLNYPDNSSPTSSVSGSGGFILIGTGAAGNSSGGLKSASYVASGTKFTVSGLSSTNTSGGATAGLFTLGANGAGTVTVTMGSSATAPTGWSCWASDQTTLAALVDQSASTTTTAAFNIPITSLNGDAVTWGCLAY